MSEILTALLSNICWSPRPINDCLESAVTGFVFVEVMTSESLVEVGNYLEVV